VDGVFTDGALYIGTNGQEFKKFHVLDGLGIALLKAVGLPLAIISGRSSEATIYRMKELGLDENLYQGNLAKKEPYILIKKKFGLQDEEIAYIGDDLADIPLLKQVGVPVSVANASEEVKEKSFYVTSKAGGEGAIREFIELVLKAQGKFKKALEIVTKDTYKDK
ncbi:MAG: 3-deoxy-D-manno-octulosonate 8-phosphate phosphatase, partial [Candidatus Neomarinimicrobiota bacterium]